MQAYACLAVFVSCVSWVLSELQHLAHFIWNSYHLRSVKQPICLDKSTNCWLNCTLLFVKWTRLPHTSLCVLDAASYIDVSLTQLKILIVYTAGCHVQWLTSAVNWIKPRWTKSSCISLCSVRFDWWTTWIWAARVRLQWACSQSTYIYVRVWGHSVVTLHAVQTNRRWKHQLLKLYITSLCFGSASLIV